MNELNMDQALKLYLSEALAKIPSQHPERTPDCVSLIALNWHVRGKRRLAGEQRSHINRCPFCQRMHSLTKNHCGHAILALAAKTRALVEKLFSGGCLWPTPIWETQTLTETRPRPAYPLVVEDDEGNVMNEDSRVVIVDGPFITPDDFLTMRVTLQVPERLHGSQNMQLLFLLKDPEQPVCELDLPGLEEQLLKVSLPKEIINQLKEQVEADAGLPFALVLRIGKTELQAASEEILYGWIAPAFQRVLVLG